MAGSCVRRVAYYCIRHLPSKITYTALRTLILVVLFTTLIYYAVHFHSWSTDIRKFTDKYPGGIRNWSYFSNTNKLIREHFFNKDNFTKSNLSTPRRGVLDNREVIDHVSKKLRSVDAYGHKSREKSGDYDKSTDEFQDVSLQATNQNRDDNSTYHDRNQSTIDKRSTTENDKTLPKQSIVNHRHGNNGTTNYQTHHTDVKISPSSTDLPSVQPRVLLGADVNSVFTAKTVAGLLESQRVDFDFYFQAGNKTPHTLSIRNSDDSLTGRYSLMIFADYASVFYKWPKPTRTALVDYSKKFGVTMVVLTRTPKNISQPSPGYYTATHFVLDDVITHSVGHKRVKFLELNEKRDYHMLKNAGRILQLPSGVQWHMFLPMKSLNIGHVTDVTMATEDGGDKKSVSNENSNVYATISYRSESKFNSTKTMTSPLVLVTKGLNNSVRKVLIGSPVTFWLTKMLLFEILKDESRMPLLRIGLERSIMVDIDDIFVAPDGRKMNVSDVQALIEAQERFRSFIPTFTFNLGFCGHYFKRGTAADVRGSEELIIQKNRFWWFGHTFNHYQPHKHDLENLTLFMSQNKEFALSHSIPAFDNHYSVTPHHSGVYPIHQPLYDAWRKVWNVTVTTTEEYPHLRPEFRRRGFVHDGVSVLPRQTCTLFTHTYSYDTYIGGETALRGVAEGGEVFTTILYNPISIFMTHVTNYAVDRLALNLFDQLFHFITKWTKLRLTTDRPLNLAKKYFELFPEERTPLWTSPCKDKRHLDIWPKTKNCSRLPNLLILGPQKTGSTALQSFLKIHPAILSNHQTKEHFEETQFFSSDGMYQRGIEWYMDQFPVPDSQTTRILFEKSATYFTNTQALKRIHALLPKVKLIVILVDPAKRAYSWYQHMRAHKDPTSLKYTFSQVIHSYTHTTHDKHLLALKDKCLSPGRYHIHIKRWLSKFSSKQLLPVDGSLLVERPVAVLNEIQNFTEVDYLNFSKLLSYNNKKGFHCINTPNGKTQCLGPSKGRHYKPMSKDDGHYLEDYYKKDNEELLALLKRHSWRVPKWLHKPPP